MAASMDDDDGFQADDLYVLLNVDKKATNQEISKAYRRMSKIFHPDRHHDPVKKKQADVFFNKIKNAYEILSDPNKREIYNRYGMEGLNVQGLEIITRTKSPAEIIAELDRLKYEEEQRRLQRTSPAGEIEVRINATNVFGGYPDYEEYDSEYQDDLNYVEITEIRFSQSVEYPLTAKDTTIIGGTVSSKNGIGSGNFLVGYRRQTSDKGWLQGNMGFGSGMTFALQGYRQLTKRCYGKCSTFFGTDETMRRQTMGLSFLISNQFDSHFRGEMALIVAAKPSLRTTIHYDNGKNRALFTVQVGKSNFAKAVYSRSFETHISNMDFEVIGGSIGWFFAYGVRMKISEFSTIHAKLKITNNGGVSLDIGARRGRQSYFFPILLSEQVLPSSIFYGTFLPTVAYFAVKKLIVDPYVKRKESEDLKKKQERDSDELQQKKKDAEAAVELMQRTVEKSLEQETNRNGLIILKALYGRLVTQDGELVESECIDVKVPLQAQVTDSQLIILESNTKSDLPGFYDPCPGQEKSLYIRYNFRNRPHQVTYEDKDPIRLPLQRHVMQDEKDESFAHQ